MLAFDHLIVIVDDLDAGGVAFNKEHGLASVAGGRHQGHGTGNRIVPLWSSYIELVAVLDPDEAEGSAFGSWVARHPGGPAAICLRTDDIEEEGRLRGLDPFPMARRTPDGATLNFRVVGLAEAFSEGLPFFIQWDVPPGLFPGRMEVQHRIEPVDLSWVEVPVDEERLRAWLRDDPIALRPAATFRAAIATRDEEILLG